jgi:hypothetical protein
MLPWILLLLALRQAYWIIALLVAPLLPQHQLAKAKRLKLPE